MIRNIFIPESVRKARLDKVLGELCPDLSRSRLKILIQTGHVSVDEQQLSDPAQKVSGPLSCCITIPEAVGATPTAEDIPLDIVYEDDDLLLVNKQAGLVVHPAFGHATGTLVNALLYHCGDRLSGIGGVKRPGIVHRLDKETSGLMVVAKNDLAHQKLSEQFATRSLSRLYTAYVWGCINKEGVVDAPIGRSRTNRKKMAVYHHESIGKDAVTHYQRQAAYGLLASKVICQLQTGRTHQIRVHLASIGHGIINDPLYGSPKRGLNPQLREEVKSFSQSSQRQALHAHVIQFIHPRTGKNMRFAIPLAEDLKILEESLKAYQNNL